MIVAYTFRVFGKAEPAGSKRPMAVRRKDERGNWIRTGQTIVIDANPNAAKWKERVAQIVGEIMDGRALLEGPLFLDVTVYRPRLKLHFGKKGLLASAPDYPDTKPDTTKLVRGIEDALTGVVWRDDAQVVEQKARKRWGDPASVEIKVGPMWRLRALPVSSAEQKSLLDVMV